MPLKILATGDFHIGKKSSAVQQETEESATKFTWHNIVDYAIHQKIDVLALTGDIVDQDNRYFEAIGPLQNGFEKLKQAGISVFMVAGNHDFNVLPELTNTEKYNNVHLLGAEGTWEQKTFVKNGEEIQFVGWSFPTRHFREDPFSTFNLEIDANKTTIGLLHGEVDVPLSNYAPINMTSFSNRAVEVWILGHIHKPQFLQKSEPTVFYPGSPHALSAKETGPHGPYLLTVQSSTNIQIEQIPLSPVRYDKLKIDVTDKTTKNEIRDWVIAKLIEDAQSKIVELENVSFLIYDLVLVGQHSRISELETWVTPIIDDYNQELGPTETQMSVRKITLKIEPKVENMEELAQEASPAGVLAETILALERGEETEFANDMMKEWKSKQLALKQTSVYHPLRTGERFDLEEEDKQMKQYLLNECNRMLTTLIQQQNQ
ncbi:MAG TPA: DNA repair exonuclease [Flavobacteriaceae bacterium]|nr:DNA repair exonuclease [Flavobacteriaceae bacterium]